MPSKSLPRPTLGNTCVTFFEKRKEMRDILCFACDFGDVIYVVSNGSSSRFAWLSDEERRKINLKIRRRKSRQSISDARLDPLRIGNYG